MSDEGTVFAVKNGGQGRIHRQIIEDRSERPLQLGFGRRFTVRSGLCRCHFSLVMRSVRIVAMHRWQFNEKPGI